MGRGAAAVMIAAGIVLALVSLFADPLGLGQEARFGWKQAIGLAVGIALLIAGMWRRRRSSA